MKKGLAVLGGCLIAMVPIIVLAGTVYTLLLPNIYASSARISVSDDELVMNLFPEPQQYSAYDPDLLKKRFEMIQSKPILYEVINRLNLQQEWGRDGEKLLLEIAYEILRNSVQVFQLRDTPLMTISVKRDNPDEAAEIANEITVAYRNYRLDSALKNARRDIDKTATLLKHQLKRVEAAEEKIEQLRVELDISIGGIKDVDEIMQDGSEKYRPFRLAMSELETERLVYNQLKIKHRQQVIVLEVGRNPVEIIDIAEPNRRPVSPNLFLNIIISVVIAVPFGLTGAVLLIFGFKKSTAVT